MEHEFKPFDKVLVRDHDYQRWDINIYRNYIKDSIYSYQCLKGDWKQCIPYEGNEHLFFKNDNLEEAQEFRFGDKVQVRDRIDDPWNKAIFIEKVDHTSPYCVIIKEEKFTTYWKHCRKTDW